MVNYKDSMIYKIVCKDLDVKHCYIGSTTSMKHRKSLHKSICNNPNNKGYNSLKYKIIRDNGGFANWEMVLIHYYPCETKLELHKEERRIKELFNDDLGTNIPSRSQKEYNEDNKDTRKQWRKNKKDHIKDYSKQYYEENKNKISENGKIKIECDICKCMISKGGYLSHQKTTKHINNLNSLT